MRIIPIGFDYWKDTRFTMTLDILSVETTNHQDSLLWIGWWEGEFVFDFCYLRSIRNWLELKREDRR